MFIIVGLGNPGEEYQHSRHNAGWMFVEAAVRAWQFPLLFDQKRCHARISKSNTTILAQPTTFMNGSGQAVAEIFSYYKVPLTESLSNLVVVHDDLDLPVGTVKVLFGKGPKVHNGLLSIYKHLKTTSFWHVRLGVDGRNGDRTLPGSAYVLQSFLPAEKELFQGAVEKSLQQVHTLITNA